MITVFEIAFVIRVSAVLVGAPPAQFVPTLQKPPEAFVQIDAENALAQHIKLRRKIQGFMNNNRKSYQKPSAKASFNLRKAGVEVFWRRCAERLQPVHHAGVSAGRLP